MSSRFQETSAEFEQARNKARKAKIEFETVKKSRSVTIGFASAEGP